MKKHFDTASLLLTPEQLQTIGRIAVESAHIEAMVDRFILVASELEEHKIRIFMAGKMIDAKLEILKELVLPTLKELVPPKRSEARQEGFSKVIGFLRHANAGRVSAIHGVWSPMSEGWEKAFPPPGNAKGVNRSKPHLTPLKASELERVAKEISHAHLILLFQFTMFSQEQKERQAASAATLPSAEPAVQSPTNMRNVRNISTAKRKPKPAA